MLLLSYFDPEEPVANLSGTLPHWRQEGTTYFVTFRLADSLPVEKLTLWKEERDEWNRLHPEPHDGHAKRDYYERIPQQLQRWLDLGTGSCLLLEWSAGQTVRRALKHFEGQRYELGAFVVAANHVHAIVTPLGTYELSKILHTWKSFTAHELLKLRSSRGVDPAMGSKDHRVWQKESFDHIIRSPESLEKFEAYIKAHREYQRPC